MDQILEAIRAERARQDEQWGGVEHDVEHWPKDWLRFIEEHAHKALVDGDTFVVGPQYAPDFRQRMVEVAALAVAAIQAYDYKVAHPHAGLAQRKDWQVVWVQSLMEMAGMTPEPEVLEEGLTETEAQVKLLHWRASLAGAVGVRVFMRLRPGAVHERLDAMAQAQRDRQRVQDAVDHIDTELLPPA